MTTRVLFNWKPREMYDLDAKFRRRIARAGWCTHPQTVQVRCPSITGFGTATALAEKAGEAFGIYDWHHDEGNPRHKFIVWSNTMPTQVRFPDGSLLPVRDGDVILIDNDEVEHRGPRPQPDVKRWFVRTGLVIEATDQ